ncbi:unnamed protein product [Schistosoma curassoni]|uniref:Reverse transcriptase domain-containing protein n=1 Tax=Schistosoma curassoni TaxID=6186 RepID=A0A183JGC7_9TREM|nr:unnamed protein product [Schistosoma curassoni]
MEMAEFQRIPLIKTLPKDEQINMIMQVMDKDSNNCSSTLNPRNTEAASMDLSINVGPPIIEKIIVAIRPIKSGKAAGPDNIPAEALEVVLSATAKIIHILLSKIWDEEHVSRDWKEGHLINIQKKGDIRKVYNRALLNRIEDCVDAKLRHQQAGFCKDRSCTDQIATLWIIVERSIGWTSPLYINFADYEKAFESVDRTTLWRLLRHYGAPEKIVNIIRNSYDGINCTIMHGGRLPDSSEIKAGVRQGWIMKTSTSSEKHGIQWSGRMQLDDLDFTDDLALLSLTQQQMQEKTTSVAAASTALGHNTTRTKRITLDHEALENA